jgi:hypothetical protein
MGSWSHVSNLLAQEEAKNCKKSGLTPIASYNIRITLFAFLGGEERNAARIRLREPITLGATGPRDKDHHTFQCDTHPERLRRGEAGSGGK